MTTFTISISITSAIRDKMVLSSTGDENVVLVLLTRWSNFVGCIELQINTIIIDSIVSSERTLRGSPKVPLHLMLREKFKHSIFWSFGFKAENIDKSLQDIFSVTRFRW